MHEHRKKRTRRPGRIANANYPLSEAARKSVTESIDSLNGGADFATSYLRSEFLTKYCDESLVPGSERRANAIRKFLECEAKNLRTNLTISSWDEEFNILPRVSTKSFLRFARRLIRDILGPLHDGVVLGSFSGGASTSRRRTSSNPAWKFVGKADITEEAWKFLDIVYREMPMLRQYNSSFTELNTVEGSVLFTVPKKADIDRCACKEPDINMFLQKGVGSHIRRRLRHFGIDLNDQGINRSYAKEGSVSGLLATLDLSSASDTITIQCVKTLLPTVWFEYLNDIRSKVVNIDGETFRMEMFSSMGNGFTFELESLIFYALMRTTAYFTNTPGVISVYGDDIIVPSECSDLCVFVLQRFGFSVNEDKSFTSGFFRESCGGHYAHGNDVTPFYLKRPPTRLTDVIRVCNQLRRWAFADVGRQYVVENLYQVWYSLAQHVPKVLWGGYDYGLDTQLVSPPGGRSVLMRVSAPMRLPPVGSYIHWHNSSWNRTQPSDSDVKPVSTNQICRLRRAQKGAPVCLDYFREELV